MIHYEKLDSPCSSEERALASGARCKGSSPFRGSLQLDSAECSYPINLTPQKIMDLVGRESSGRLEPVNQSTTRMTGMKPESKSGNLFA